MRHFNSASKLSTTSEWLIKIILIMKSCIFFLKVHRFAEIQLELMLIIKVGLQLIPTNDDSPRYNVACNVYVSVNFEKDE